MGGKDPPPEHLRCKRTDGRQWRCKRRAMDGRTLCDIHYLQGKHRQNKKKVPDSLKLERQVTKKRGQENGESSRSHRVSKKTKMPLAVKEKSREHCVSEALDEALKKMKLKKGDLQLELIRVFLKRQVEKKKEKELKENAVADETRRLPYGIMAISQSPPNLQKFRQTEGLNVKVGVDSNANNFSQRHFRSKNIEPMPIVTMQVVPFAEIVKKKKIKRCHWCREIKHNRLIKCLSCRKRFFCLDCIKQRYFDKKEVKVKCPACRGTCGCKLCKKQQYRVNNQKETCRAERKLEKINLLHYLIYMLLPVLKQINYDQRNELETEATATGKKQSEILIPLSQSASHSLYCCTKCKTSIPDYHRSCMKCSYNLCLSCCQEISRHSLHGNFSLKSCKKKKINSSTDELLVKKSIKKWEVSADGSIPCPPKDIGGCGHGHLGLRCIFPFTWTKDLEARTEEILSSYQYPAAVDVSTSCSLCNKIDFKDDEFKPQRELSKKEGFSDNYLYCPTLKNLHQETLEHFQNHWGKGQPVIVRNVLKSSSNLCWDPVTMFSSYLESKSSGSCSGSGRQATNCLDWCEVEIDTKRIFMGSLEKRTHASMLQKVLKLKACISSHLFQKQFPVHYNEILSSLPLPGYVSPMSGLLNVGVKLPNELPQPDLGPCIHLSYGGLEEITQAEFLSKLCYESHDMVNILAYATDAPVSAEQISKIENLMKKYKAQVNNQDLPTCYSSDQKAKSSMHSEDTGESGLQDEEKIVPPNAIENETFRSGDPLKDCGIDVEKGILSDDCDSDAEASILYCGSIDQSEESDKCFEGGDVDSSCSSEDKQGKDSSGAQWDIFCRQDVPKLLEYIRRHSNELTPARSCTKYVHPILDQEFFLDAYHKLKLKEEFDIQPWTFEQHPGEAIFIPAGCPYQIRKLKSCVNVVLDFISPENATHCIQLTDEIRHLPTWHKAKRKTMEVKRMALHGISAAVEDLCSLMHMKQDSG